MGHESMGIGLLGNGIGVPGSSLTGDIGTHGGDMQGLACRQA